MSELLPPGVALLDAPHPFHQAISTALVFLSWMENLEKRDMPPKRIWTDDKKLAKWFNEIDRRRKDEMKAGGPSTEVEGWDGEMVKNEAASMLYVDDD